MTLLQIGRRDFLRQAGTVAVAGTTFATMPRAWAAGDEAVPAQGFATLHVKPERFDAFLAVLRQNAQQARQAPGNVSFTIFCPTTGGNTLYVLEQWQDQSAYKTHMQQPSLLAMHKAAAEDLDGSIGHLFLRTATTGSGLLAKPVENPAETVNIVVNLKLKPGTRDKLVSQIDQLLPQFRNAPGNISFDVYAPVSGEPDTLVQIERWSSTETHNANLKRPVITQIRADFAQMLARPMLDGRLLLNDITLG